MFTSLAMFGLGVTELIILGAILLLLFGSRLPSVMRNLGRGVVEFKKGVRGIEDDLDQESQRLDETTAQRSDKDEPVRNS